MKISEEQWDFALKNLPLAHSAAARACRRSGGVLGDHQEELKSEAVIILARKADSWARLKKTYGESSANKLTVHAISGRLLRAFTKQFQETVNTVPYEDDRSLE